MSQKHFALVSRKHCPPLTILDGDYTEERQNDCVRDELVSIYETFADLYPNPRLTEERRQRETLLEAARAASIYQHEKPQPSKKKKNSGFFSFLFGSSGEDSTVSQKHQTDFRAFDSAAGDEAFLSYTETSNPLDDGRLCGTQHSIDLSCIPNEAYSVARHHLTSTKTRRDNPNALRHAKTTCATADGSPFCMWIVVGLGEIALFQDGGEESIDESESPAVSSTSRIMKTSDRDELKGYAERSKEFCLHAVRGVVLSNCCIAVSWGFLDGITIFYRRIQIPGYLDGDGWEAVWMLGPSIPVLENITGDGQDFFHDDHEQPGSPLLRISDCLPLAVDLQSYDPYEQQSVDKVIALAIARLGGYVELVPLPSRLWEGSALTANNYRPHKQKSTERKRGRHWQHYSHGKNLSCPPQTIALHTFEYHVDVQALDSYRTSVGIETVWDNQAFPDSPPAEFVLAAVGVSREGNEKVTFWTVSTIFSETRDPNDEIGFSLHSNLIQAITADTGPSVTVFASPRIMNGWRNPRQVDLKITTNETTIGMDGKGDENNRSMHSSTRVTTLSSSAPIVSLLFSESDGSTSTYSGPFLSILDWNGGVQIMNCSVLGRVAAQNMPLHEYEQYQASNEPRDDSRQHLAFPVISALISRSSFHSNFHNLTEPVVGNLHWLRADGISTERTIPPLAVMMSNSGKLIIVTFFLPTEVLGGIRPHDVHPKSIQHSTQFPSSGATIQNLEDSNLAFVGLQIGRIKSSRRYMRRLSYVAMEQLQPVTIVETLARDSKFRQAIESASLLSVDEQSALGQVVIRCRKMMWERERDVLSLAATQDDGYIIEQSLSIFKSNSRGDGVPIDLLHSVLRLGLSCAQKSKDEVNSDKIREIMIRLGSYELLCRHFGKVVSVHQFRDDFMNVDLFVLAEQLAQRANIAALSIILYRHRKAVALKLLAALSSLPFSLDPISYCHLLPVLRNGSFSDYFLAYDENVTTNPWSHMSQYLAETERISSVLSLVDEKAVLDCNKGISALACSNLEAMVTDWFLDRAKLMQTFVGDISCVVRLCELGLHCTSEKVDQSSSWLSSPGFHQLYKTWQGACSLRTMIFDEVVVLDGDWVDTDILMEMDLFQLLDLVLKTNSDTSKILERFKTYAEPFILMLSSGKDDDGRAVDEALAAFCINEARKCRDYTVASALTALSTCNAIAECSKTTINKRDRLMKSQSVLVNMVIECSMEIVISTSNTSVSIEDQKEILDKLWSLYETLPSSSTNSGDNIKMDKLHRALVTIDILSKWPGCRAFLTAQRQYDDSNYPIEKTQDRHRGIITEICRSFNDLVASTHRDANDVLVLHDLLSDVESLVKECFEHDSDIGHLVCTSLVPGFLVEGNFQLAVAYLNWNGSVVDKTQVQNIVIDYVDEVAFSESVDETKLSRALQCQDIVGPHLPDAKEVFRSIRRCLDAYFFTSSVLYDGNDVDRLRPVDFKEMNGLDAIEIVLRSVPESIICGSTQWSDSVFALNANKALRAAAAARAFQHELEVEGKISTDSPILPGGAIFHLATMLGLDDYRSVVAVKCRVIHYAVTCKFYGAAAAVARTLVNGEERPDESVVEPFETAKLAAVANVVAEENYRDLATRKELCDRAIAGLRSSIFVSEPEPFNSILRASSSLNISISRFNQELDMYSQQRKEVLLSRSMARLYKHVFYEYASDVHVLFFDLFKQAEQQEVHDSLMNALSRFVFYWCIHDSKTLKSVVDLWDKADFKDNLALGCALLLHIPSNLTARQCAHEMEKIAADQAANVATEDRFNSVEVVEPDEGLVRRLVARGYTSHAARRAVLMTGNSGYNDALGWAVMHTMDPNFNQPLAITKPASKMYVDEESIQLLQKSLFQVNLVLEDPKSRSALIRYIEEPHGYSSLKQSTRSSQKLPSRVSVHTISPQKTLDSSYASGAHISHPKDLSEHRTSASKIQSYVTAPATKHQNQNGQGALRKAAFAVTELSDGDSVSPKDRNGSAAGTCPPAIKHSEQRHEQFTRPKELIALPTSSTKPYGVSIKHSALLNISEKASAKQAVNREEMKKRGLAALANVRGKANDERRSRLIEEGRQLLKQSRSGTLNVATPRSPTNGIGQTPNPISSPVSAVAKPKPLSSQVCKITTPENATDDDGWDFDDF